MVAEAEGLWADAQAQQSTADTVTVVLQIHVNTGAIGPVYADEAHHAIALAGDELTGTVDAVCFGVLGERHEGARRRSRAARLVGRGRGCGRWLPNRLRRTLRWLLCGPALWFFVRTFAWFIKPLVAQDSVQVLASPLSLEHSSFCR